MREGDKLTSFRVEAMVLVDKNDPSADGVFEFRYGTGEKPDPGEDAQLRRDLGLDFSVSSISDLKRRGRIATILRDRGSITEAEIRSLGGKIIKRKESE